MAEPYRLFFRDLYLGVVVQDDFDFPNLFGTFTLADKVGEDELSRHLLNYIEQSIIGNGLMEDDKMDEWEKFENALSERFLDLIETDDWYLMADGKREPIMIPIFCRDKGIVWRWDHNF